MQAGDPAALIRGDPVPLRQRQVAEPVGAVAPIGSTGRVIEHLQHLPVGHPLGPRIADRYRGPVRNAGGDPGRQRPAQAEQDRLARIEGGVLDSRDHEGRLTCRRSDGDTFRHPGIVQGGRPAAWGGRQGERHWPDRVPGLIDQAYRHRDGLPLLHLVV